MQIEYETMSRVSSKTQWAGRVISALPVALLLFSASLKIARPPAVVEGFSKSFPVQLIVVLGVTELTCTILYLIPRTSVIGAILLTGYLGGATATHVRLLDPMFVVPFFCGVLVWLGLLLREPRLHPLLPFRRPLSAVSEP